MNRYSALILSIFIVSTCNFSLALDLEKTASLKDANAFFGEVSNLLYNSADVDTETKIQICRDLLSRDLTDEKRCIVLTTLSNYSDSADVGTIMKSEITSGRHLESAKIAARKLAEFEVAPEEVTVLLDASMTIDERVDNPLSTNHMARSIACSVLYSLAESCGEEVYPHLKEHLLTVEENDPIFFNLHQLNWNKSSILVSTGSPEAMSAVMDSIEKADLTDAHRSVQELSFLSKAVRKKIDSASIESEKVRYFELLHQIATDAGNHDDVREVAFVSMALVYSDNPDRQSALKEFIIQNRGEWEGFPNADLIVSKTGLNK